MHRGKKGAPTPSANLVTVPGRFVAVRWGEEIEGHRGGEKGARSGHEQGAREPERDSLSFLFFFFLKGVWCGQRRGEWVKQEKKGGEEEEEVRHKATTARFCGRRVG